MARRRAAWIALCVAGACAAGAFVAIRERNPYAVRAWTPVAEGLQSALAVPLVAPSTDVDASPSASAPAPDAAAPVRRQRAPLSAAQLGAPLLHGPFVPACGAPDSMKVTVQVAVKAGRATEVHAQSIPANPVIEGCVERAVRDLRWDISPQMGHVTVHY
jgi:hypothetical protein